MEIEDFIPEVVICDIKFPQGSGFDLIEKIRDQHPEIPTVALTASADPETCQRSLKAGCKAFMSKPYRGEQLVRPIANSVQGPENGNYIKI